MRRLFSILLLTSVGMGRREETAARRLSSSQPTDSMVRKRKSLVTAAKVCLSIPIGRCSPISSSMPSVQEEKRFSGRILIPSPLHFSSRNLANGWQRQDVRENTYADECIRISSIRRRNPVRLERRMKGIRNEDCRSYPHSL